MARRTEPLVPVRFIVKNAPYNAGEIAGFPRALADRLIAKKRAVPYVPDSEPMSTEAAAPEEAEADAGKEEAVIVSAPISPVHIGGPYYEVAGKKVKGKKKAQELADELNKRGSGVPPTMKK